MYSGNSRSRRLQTEPEKPQSQYQWRTRVNTLMNTSDEPRESKLTNFSHSGVRGPSREKPKERTVVIDSYSDVSTSDWLSQQGSRQRSAWRDDIRRERFSRTKSADQLKTRGVRFLSDELPKTSKSLDGDGEDSPNFGKLRSRDKRHYSRDWASDEDKDNYKPPGGMKKQEDEDGNEYGACGGSFDSGLDLRVSCSPDERYDFLGDDDDGNISPRSRSHSTESDESMGFKYRDESAPESSSSVSSHSASRPIPFRSHNNTVRSGAVPKRPKERPNEQDFVENDTKSGNSEAREEMKPSITMSSGRAKKEEECPFSQSYPPRPDNFTAKRQVIKDETNDDGISSRSLAERCGFAITRGETDEIPGFSFFANKDHYTEEIIQQVIDAEEKQVKDDTEELQRLNDALMFSDEYENKTSPPMKDEDDVKCYKDEFEYSLTTDDYGGYDSYEPVARKRALSLPARVEDQEDDLTYLLFRSWKIKARKQDEENRSQDGGVEDEWACVPSVFLEDVFTFLSPKERHQASQVCRHWYDLFYSPRVWETFILLERTLTKKRFNLYKGYQRELCPWKTQICLKRVGSFFKKIVITPISDYFNLCEFLRVLEAFLEYQTSQGERAMPLLHTFDFTFACATRGSEGLLVHGTGGQILDMIVKLLIQMSNLKHLKVNQLLTDIGEVPTMFAALTQCFCECLNSLEMLNVTKVPYPITELALFRNLIKLTVSPQHIDEEVVVLLAGISLIHLHLLQDVYTCECLPVPAEAWKLVKEMAPWLRVYLEVSGITRTPLLIQPRAPVYGVFLRTPYSRLTNEVLSNIVEHYSKTLRYLVQEHLPRTHGPRGFDKRCDSSLLFLIRRCHSLHTLVVSERMSTATLILLATEGKNISTLLVRKNGLIKKCDWPSRGEWAREFYERLRENALDYDKCKDEICSILKRRWRPLSDKQFMRLKIIPKVEMH